MKNSGEKSDSPGIKKILVTGATGYIGRKLIPRLEETGYSVRCLARNPESMGEGSSSSIEVVKGDLLEYGSLKESFEGIDVAYYLVHSLDATKNFEELEKTSALNFVQAAAAAKVRKIIYLGALGSSANGALSPHLKSRKEVGRILRESGIPVIEFQASIILGSGSLSFEMIRALSERLPVMIMPKWVSVKAQPIAVDDVMEYLVQGVEFEANDGEVFEIGGPDQVSYKDLISEYSSQRRLMRLLISVPVLTPWLSSLWLALVTPLYARVGRKLIESIKNPTLVNNPRALKAFPSIKPLGVSEAIARAINENPDAGI